MLGLSVQGLDSLRFEFEATVQCQGFFVWGLVVASCFLGREFEITFQGLGIFSEFRVYLFRFELGSESQRFELGSDD